MRVANDWRSVCRHLTHLLVSVHWCSGGSLIDSLSAAVAALSLLSDHSSVAVAAAGLMALRSALMALQSLSQCLSLECALCTLCAALIATHPVAQCVRIRDACARFIVSERNGPAASSSS